MTWTRIAFPGRLPVLTDSVSFFIFSFASDHFGGRCFVVFFAAGFRAGLK
jgi:hypothetical protein